MMYPILVCSVVLSKEDVILKVWIFIHKELPFPHFLADFKWVPEKFNTVLRLQVSPLQTAVTGNVITLI
jgi:hypothetical protein